MVALARACKRVSGVRREIVVFEAVALNYNPPGYAGSF